MWTDLCMNRYAHKLNLPDSVFETRSIREIERIGIDLVLLYVLNLPLRIHRLTKSYSPTARMIYSPTAKKR